VERALLDTNVLVHAVYRGSPLHRAAAELVDSALRWRGTFFVAPQNLIEFAAVVTRPRFVDPPLDPRESTSRAIQLYRSRRLGKIYPKRGTVLRALREGAALGVRGPRWYDLLLAATMRDARLRTIVTENVDDFREFRFLEVFSIESAAERLREGTARPRSEEEDSL
jgi:predicted nucleic acid-binding protein